MYEERRSSPTTSGRLEWTIAVRHSFTPQPLSQHFFSPGQSESEPLQGGARIFTAQFTNSSKGGQVSTFSALDADKFICHLVLRMGNLLDV